MSVTARFRSTGRQITFDPTKTIGKGGEGSVYTIPNQPSVVAKVLHPGKATREKCAKIELMVANPPHDPMQSKGHTSIAWPTEILEYVGNTGPGLVNGQVIGFVMPKIAGSMRIIMSFYDRVTRLNDFPWFTYDRHLNTARNLVSGVRAIHEKGYVIGDVNESNIMVGEDTYVTIIDTDSFQVTDPNSGIVYRCTVGKEDFTAPELQGMRFSDVDRSIASDLFGIGVILFQLLMENTHPFAGIYTGSGNPPELRERIRQGFFTYSTRKSVPFKPVPLAPPFELLSPYLRNLFIRCFEDGHSNPGLRPTAKEWMDALTLAKDSLTRCSKNDQHYHGTHSPSCPWCDLKKKLTIDSFPTQNQVHATQQAIKPKPTQPRQQTAQPNPTSITFFHASASQIYTGQSVNLSWGVTGATTVAVDNGIGQVSATGGTSVSPVRNTTYTLTATGPQGTVRSRVTVNVSKPSPVQAFSANTFSIHLGQSIALNWNVAANYSVSINKKIGSVPNAGNQTVTPSAWLWGWWTLRNQAQTTYVLKAKGPNGTFRQRLKIDLTLPSLPVLLNQSVQLAVQNISLSAPSPLQIQYSTLGQVLSLLNNIQLQTYSQLQAKQIGLNNYVALVNPPKIIRRLSSMPFYQRIPIAMFRRFRRWVAES